MATRTPVLNKIAISPPAPDPAQPPSPERERVVAAMEFGAVLEDLVAHACLRQQESYAEPRASGPQFPPDLLIQCVTTPLLLGTCQKLLKLKPMLLGLDQSQGSISPSRPPPPTCLQGPLLSTKSNGKKATEGTVL